MDRYAPTTFLPAPARRFLTATTPAKLYGLYPKKGTIAVGCDADIVIWDDLREVTISNDLLHHNVDYTPYEGMNITGWPAITLSRGEVVWADSEILAEPGRGEFLPCGFPESAVPLGSDGQNFASNPRGPLTRGPLWALATPSRRRGFAGDTRARETRRRSRPHRGDAAEPPRRTPALEYGEVWFQVDLMKAAACLLFSAWQAS